MNIMLTGATGFIGSAIVQHLFNLDHNLSLILREDSIALNSHVNKFILDLQNLSSLPSGLFSNIDCVIHLAGRAHVLLDSSDLTFSEYKKVNVDGTLNLARLASLSGVKRFVFISSIKVNGEGTLPSRPFKSEDAPCPEDFYGKSKLEAESELLKLASESQMEVVIIRPPLVYGPGVKANFASMISWVKKGIPLPFGSVDNKRSLVALDNLIDFILLCADRVRSPKAANQVFIISDGEDLSTTKLLRKVAEAYEARSRLLPVPVSFMRLAAKLLGKTDLADRLFDNLQVDSSKARDLLGWKPVITIDEQLKKMADFDKNVCKQ